jgi:histidinol-phosphatase
MELNNKKLGELLGYSCSIVRKSSDITMKYYRKKIKYKLKENLSPVTIADLKCENYLIKKIKTKFPAHNILSEENGIKENNSDFKWIIDPIDGTKNFMRHNPFWGTLLALEYLGKVVLGVVYLPALNEFIYAAKGTGTFYNGKRVKVSKHSKIEESFLIYGGIDYILKSSYKQNFFKLAEKCFHTRGFGDCHGYTLIMNGGAEIMLDPHVAPYDIAALKICIEEAGGKLTSVTGNDSIYEGTALATNGMIHNKVLRILHSKKPGLA